MENFTTDHEHGDLVCQVPQSECKIYEVVELICNDWDRETKKRERQRSAGWKLLTRALWRHNISPDSLEEFAEIYFTSHERPSIRHSRIK